MSLETTIFQISKHRLELFLEELVDKNYIKGLTVRHSINGNPIISIGNPRLTLDGLDFLENNSSMKKAYKFLKEAKEWIPGL